jgi:hypothetical protein
MRAGNERAARPADELVDCKVGLVVGRVVEAAQPARVSSEGRKDGLQKLTYTSASGTRAIWW